MSATQMVGVAAPAMACAGVVVVISVVLFVLGLVGVLKVPFKKTVVWVLLGIFLSTSLRLIWWAMEFTQSNYTARYIINRLAWTFFTITFLLLLFGWIEAVHSRYPPPTEKFVPVIGIILAVTAGVVVVFTIIVLILAFALYGGVLSGGSAAGTPLYDAHVIFVAVLQAVVSLGFLVYGIILLARMSSVKVGNAQKSKRQKETFVKIVIITSVFFATFGVRAAMLLYRPITNAYIIAPVFYVFAYILPDTLPPLAQMFILITTSVSASKALHSTESTKSYEMQQTSENRLDERLLEVDETPNNQDE